MTSPSDLKASIRKSALAKRDDLSPQQHENFSHKILQNFEPFLPKAETVVSVFWPIRSEVDTRPLMEFLRSHGCKVVLPVVMDKTTIEFRLWEEQQELVPGSFGTMGPADSAPALDPDLLLMPLAAFDNKGGRIGYGAGYYDRAISRLVAKGRKPDLFGIAFSCQEVDHVPQEEHDVPLHRIITETGVLTVS